MISILQDISDSCLLLKFESFLQIVLYVITFLINLYRECSTDTTVDSNPKVLLAQTVCADPERSGTGHSAITGTGT